MARNNSSYFTFKGTTSTAMNALFRSVHSISRGKMRGKTEAASGRDGYIWLSDGALEQFDMKVSGMVAQSGLRAVVAWLNGSGRLSFSSELTVEYEARIIKQVDYKKVTLDSDPLYEFTVTFTCQPYAYIVPTAQDITVTTSGAAFTNPGTYWSQPKIYINGSGAFTVTISNGTESSSMFFSGVPSDGIVLDSEKMDAFNADETQLLNGCVLDASDDFFRIYPGVNTLTWTTGGEDESGTITSVTITPRWRNI